MSLSPNEKYPGATEADPNYKDGKFKDNNPSTTNNGSPLKSLDRNEQLALQEAVMDAAGFEYSGVVDTPQNSQMFAAYKAALSNGANLLSNHNFLTQTPDDSLPKPGATAQSYPPGYQIFSGVFANETTGISNLTYIDGRVSFSGGDFYMAAPNTGALENTTEFVASVAGFDGKPRTRGVSFALVGDEYRVTVGVDALEGAGAVLTPLSSVKFERGSVATGHNPQAHNGEDYVFNTVAEMVAIGAPVGSLIKTSFHTTIGDGGGALYYVVRGNSGDGISRHNMGSNTATLLDDSGRIKAEQIGIKKDDPTALNADLFTYASINYDVLECGAGEYRIEKPCYFNKTIDGVGKRITYLVTDDDTDGSFRYDATHGPTSMHLNNLTVCSRSYINTSARDTSGTSFWLTGRPVFKNVEVFGYGETGVLVPGDTKDPSFTYRLLLGSFEHCNFQFCGIGFELDHSQVGGNFTTTSTWKDCYIASCDTGFKADGLVASEFDNIVFEFCTLGAEIGGGRVKVSKWYFEQCVTPYDFNSVVSTIMSEYITGNTNEPIVTRNRSNQPKGATSYVQPTRVSSQKLGLLWDDPDTPITAITQKEAGLSIDESSILRPIKVENMPTLGANSGDAALPVIHGDGAKILTLKIASDGTLAYPNDYVSAVSKVSQGIYEVVFQSSVRLTFAQATSVTQYNPSSTGNKTSIQMVELAAPNNNWTRFRSSPYTITGFRINVSDTADALVDSELVVMLIIDA